MSSCSRSKIFLSLSLNSFATLSLQLLQERASRTEQRLLALETRLALPGKQALVPLTVGSVPGLSAASEAHPTEKRAPLIPLIACTATGSYALICPKEGELHITPDSAEWFAWLTSLSSFRREMRSI